MGMPSLCRHLLLLSVLSGGLACSPGASTSPLSSVTVQERRAGPSATHGLDTVFVIDAVLDLKSTGLLDYVDAKSRMTFIQGQHKRFDAAGGTLLVQGDTCRLSITLKESEYHEAFGLIDYDPIVRIGITLNNGIERMTAGVLHRKPSTP